VQIWLLDPRPNLPTVVKMVEHGFALSEASHSPVMLELRIRACHVHGSFECKDNIAPAISRLHPLETPVGDLARFCLPPWTYAQERNKIDVRWPAAVDYIARHQLNEVMPGTQERLGIIVQGGMYNGVIRSFAAASASPTPSAPRRSRFMCSTSPIRWCLRKSSASARARTMC